MELERNVKGFDQSARKALLTHSWPGNVRELRLTVQVAVLHTAGDMVSAKDLEITGEHICTSCSTLKDEEQEKNVSCTHWNRRTATGIWLRRYWV